MFKFKLLTELREKQLQCSGFFLKRMVATEVSRKVVELKIKKRITSWQKN
jgi:hypothetical protein